MRPGIPVVLFPVTSPRIEHIEQEFFHVGEIPTEILKLLFDRRRDENGLAAMATLSLVFP